MDNFSTNSKQKESNNKKSPGRRLITNVKAAILTRLFYGDTAPDVSDPNILDEFEVTAHAVTSIVAENHEERLRALERRFPPASASSSMRRRESDHNVIQMRRSA